MNLLIRHWSFDPFILVVAAIAGLHRRGQVARLGAMAERGRDTRPLRRQALIFYAGLAVLLAAVVSPLDYWADDYLYVHMIQHIVLAFFAPTLVVLGAPWLSLLRGLPLRLRRAYGTLVRWSHRSRFPSSLRTLLARPVLAVVAFNAVMVLWHLPGPFDFAAGHPLAHIWLEHGSFFGFGLIFWLQMLDSPPFHPILPPLRRAAALLATNVVMVLIAMTMSMFTGPLYSVYAEVPGRVLSQFGDQQLAAGILWVCGDLTIAPALMYNVRLWLTAEDAGGQGTRRSSRLRQRGATA